MIAACVPSSAPVPHSAATLLGRVRAAFVAFPDARKESNSRRYEMEDAALSAFAVFFSQCPSFLDSQVRMQKQQGKNNASSLFGVHEIPSDNQIRNLLDWVPPETLFPLITEIGDELYHRGYLDQFRSIGGTFLIALDGTDFFSSQNVCCDGCLQAKLANGKTQYRHIAVTPVLVAPGQESVIALAPEFVVPQDGHKKQDCELAAAKRWLEQRGAHYAARGVTYLGDDLYAHHPFCKLVREQNAHFLFTCKPDSHQTVYEWVNDLCRNGGVHRLVVARRIGKKLRTDTYRYVNQLPLRNGNDALEVDWCELVTTDENGKVLYRNAWVTSHNITRDNVVALAAAGRARWKIENENNNTLKTKGYHFDHNFGHGKQHLANLFATMILLAFLLHTTLDKIDNAYRAVRDRLPSRRTFFEHLRALLQYLPFDSWDHLMNFMLDRLDAPGTG